jgi:Uma2 family endonuclease
MAIQDSPTRVGMALADYIAQQGEAPFEIIDGAIIAMAPSVFGSGEVARVLLEALFAYNAARQQVRIYSDTAFVLPDTADTGWVTGARIPDVMVYDRARLEAYQAAQPDWRNKPLMLAPDLAVEIISPTDPLPKVWRKAAGYLEDGVHLAWVINPMRQQVTIFAEGEAPITLDQTAHLNGDSVLTGFTMRIADLF